MTAKEYFAQIPSLDGRINAKLDQLEYLKALATKTSAVLSDMPRSDSPDLQQLSSTVVKIVDLGVELNRDIDTLVNLKREALEAVRSLESPEQQLILEYRYLLGKTWKKVMAETNYSLASLYRIHALALENVNISKVESKQD